MKWIIFIPIISLLTACACCTNNSYSSYHQVNYAPLVTSPVYYDPVSIVDDSPIDVTTTTVDYY
ncbi:MAG: hypothetical protein H0U70_11740 [Tatlockia sp.]|nr:hypothetical protein [Tatlockia sp.]